MTKYNSKFKVKIVHEYLDGGISYRDLQKKYHISDYSFIRIWVKQAQQHGMNSLIVKHKRQTYTQDFKLAVVDYIQTNEVSRVQAAIHFGISPSQTTSWMNIYRDQGVVGLRPKPCGRRPTMSQHKNQARAKKHLTPSKEEKYKQQITELKHQLHEAELDRDILKALAAITKKQPK